MDRAASALRFAFSPTPSLSDWRRIVHEIKDARVIWDARGWTERPASYHAEPPPLHEPSLRRTNSRGAEFSHLSFESDYTPHPEEPGRGRWLDYHANRTAHAWVFRHSGRPRPWLMCIHGYGLGIPFVDLEIFRVAWLHKELGLNVVLPVLPLHGPRKTGWQSGDGFCGGDVLDTIHAEAQTIWDLRRMLSWVRAQEPDAVGVYGVSLGGYNSALLAAFDPDLACAIAGIPASDLVQLARLHSRRSALLLAEQAGLNWDDVYSVLRVISPLALPPCIPHERRYVFGGLADCIVPPDQVRALCAHWQQPAVTWYEGSHLSFPMEPLVRSFLRDALDATIRQPDRDVPGERAVA